MNDVNRYYVYRVIYKYKKETNEAFFTSRNDALAYEKKLKEDPQIDFVVTNNWSWAMDIEK